MAEERCYVFFSVNLMLFFHIPASTGVDMSSIFRTSLLSYLTPLYRAIPTFSYASHLVIDFFFPPTAHLLAPVLFMPSYDPFTSAKAPAATLLA